MSTQSKPPLRTEKFLQSLVTRVAVAFNAIDYFIASLLNEEPTNNPSEQITVPYMEYLPAQKEMFADFRKEIVETSKEKPRTQPIELDITAVILCFPGRLVSYQAFKKFASRSLRSVQKQEYHLCTQRLQHYGRVVELGVPCCAQKVHVFLNKTAGEIINWPADAPCSQEQYNERISEPLNIMDHYLFTNVRTRTLVIKKYILMRQYLFIS